MRDEKKLLGMKEELLRSWLYGYAAAAMQAEG
jgi:hypothetical protein